MKTDQFQAIVAEHSLSEILNNFELMQNIAKRLGVRKLNSMKKSELEKILKDLFAAFELQDQLTEMKYNDMVSLASKNNVMFIGLKREELRSKLIETLVLPFISTLSVEKKRRALRENTKSAQIIEMHLQGHGRYAIAKALNTWYSFVHGVIKRYEERNQSVISSESEVHVSSERVQKENFSEVVA